MLCLSALETALFYNRYLLILNSLFQWPLSFDQTCLLDYTLFLNSLSNCRANSQPPDSFSLTYVLTIAMQFAMPKRKRKHLS